METETNLEEFRKLPATIERAKTLRGNWFKFQSFAWSGRPDEGAEEYAIVYTLNRDSDILERSNAEEIAKAMAPFLFEEAEEEEHRHWACGWVRGYSIRCLDSEGNATRAIACWLRLQDRLANYPILNEIAYSRMEYDATADNIREAGRRFVAQDAPQGWEGEAYSWLAENDPGAVEPRDGEGGSPSEDSVVSCLVALGFADEEALREELTEEAAEQAIQENREAKRERARNQPGQGKFAFPM